MVELGFECRSLWSPQTQAGAHICSPAWKKENSCGKLWYTNAMPPCVFECLWRLHLGDGFEESPYPQPCVRGDKGRMATFRTMSEHSLLTGEQCTHRMRISLDASRPFLTFIALYFLRHNQNLQKNLNFRVWWTWVQILVLLAALWPWTNHFNFVGLPFLNNEEEKNTVDVLQNCAHETYIILLCSVTPINSIKIIKIFKITNSWHSIA